MWSFGRIWKKIRSPFDEEGSPQNRHIFYPCELLDDFRSYKDKLKYCHSLEEHYDLRTATAIDWWVRGGRKIEDQNFYHFSSGCVRPLELYLRGDQDRSLLLLISNFRHFGFQVLDKN